MANPYLSDAYRSLAGNTGGQGAPTVQARNPVADTTQPAQQAATASTPSTFIPGISTYAQDSLVAKQAYDLALSNISTRRAGLMQQYGLTADVGEDGTLNNTRINPYAQHGYLQNMMSEQGRQLDQSYTGSRMRGLGHAGLGAQGESSLRFQHAGQSAALGSQFLASGAGLASEQAQARAGYNGALSAANTKAAQDAITNGYWTTPKYTDPAETTTNTTTLPPGVKKAPAPVVTGKSVIKPAVGGQTSNVAISNYAKAAAKQLANTYRGR